MGDPKQATWHLSKEISIALVVGMIMQFSGFVWYASALSAQVAQNSRDIVRLDAQRDLQASQALQLNDRVIRIEERLVGFGDVLERIEKSLTEYMRVQGNQSPR